MVFVYIILTINLSPTKAVALLSNTCYIISTVHIVYNDRLNIHSESLRLKGLHGTVTFSFGVLPYDLQCLH